MKPLWTQTLGWIAAAIAAVLLALAYPEGVATHLDLFSGKLPKP
jgi:hypothetical protein